MVVVGRLFTVSGGDSRKCLQGVVVVHGGNDGV